MANQGILAQSKPTAATNTVLYSCGVDQSASTVLTIANDGTGSTYSVAVKNFDQKLTLNASTYKLHPGDVISSYRLDLDTSVSGTNTFFTPETIIKTDDGEKTFKIESLYKPEITTVYVKDVSLRLVSLDTSSGTFNVGDTITTGVAPDDTTAVIYAATQQSLYIGPSTINGGGAEFADGDSITSNSGATATIAVGGIGTAGNEFVFSTTTAGGTYNAYFLSQLSVFGDRVYRFDVSDSSMTGRDFKLSDTVNGEWGADGTIGTGDDGTEYAVSKTTNGTAGSANAYVQYDFGANAGLPQILYFYDGGTGTASNADYGGSNRQIQTISAASATFSGIYIYDLEGTIVNNSDAFTVGGITYTITGQASGPYGFVRSYSGTTLYVIKGIGSADFAGTDTFQDNPKDNDGTRTVATVSSVLVATDAVEAENYIAIDDTNDANGIAKITSLVVGPGERVVVNSTTQNNVFSLIGFEDLSTTFDVRAYGTTPAQ